MFVGLFVCVCDLCVVWCVLHPDFKATVLEKSPLVILLEESDGLQ